MLALSVGYVNNSGSKFSSSDFFDARGLIAFFPNFALGAHFFFAFSITSARSRRVRRAVSWEQCIWRRPSLSVNSMMLCASRFERNSVEICVALQNTSSKKRLGMSRQTFEPTREPCVQDMRIRRAHSDHLLVSNQLARSEQNRAFTSNESAVYHVTRPLCVLIVFCLLLCNLTARSRLCSALLPREPEQGCAAFTWALFETKKFIRSCKVCSCELPARL